MVPLCAQTASCLLVSNIWIASSSGNTVIDKVVMSTRGRYFLCHPDFTALVSVSQEMEFLDHKIIPFQSSEKSPHCFAQGLLHFTFNTKQKYARFKFLCILINMLYNIVQNHWQYNFLQLWFLNVLPIMFVGVNSEPFSCPEKKFVKVEVIENNIFWENVWQLVYLTVSSHIPDVILSTKLDLWKPGITHL